MRTPRISFGTIEFEVLVHGRPVREYPHQGMTFIEGRKGSEYTLRIRNNTNRRVTAVVSVDGLSVMTGKNASRTDSGYIIETYGYVDIPGWRLNDEEVAHFFFGALPEAYATQMGKPDNIGVMGAMIFFEKRPDWDEAYLLQSGATLGAMRGFESPTPKGVGTGFGQRTSHVVTHETFNREDDPAFTMIIRYDEADSLFQNYGIRVTSAHEHGDRIIDANPFPGDNGAEPPPGWRG